MRRSAWLASTGSLLVGAVVGAVVMALAYPEVDRSPISNSTRDILVTVTVQRRPVRTPVVVSGTVRPPVVAALVPNASMDRVAGSGREVVSGRTRKVGDVLRYGDLVAEVSGRPVFALPANVPLYRDMELGMSGSDVAALQRTLTDLRYFRSPTNGQFGQTTLDALQGLFHAARYDVPTLASGQPGLPLADTTTLPGNGLRVTRAAPVGTVLGATAAKVGADAVPPPLVEVEVERAAVTARVDLVQADVFQPGRGVTVRIGSAEAAAAAVESVGPFQEAASSLPAGYDIVVAIPEQLAAGAVANAAATIAEVPGEIPQGAAVPLVSIRQDADGPFVLVAGPDGSANAAHRVPVKVRGQADGYAIVEDNPDLPEKAIVIVAGVEWPPQP